MRTTRRLEDPAGSGAEFLTWCRVTDAGCALMVHVPELRRYDAEAKDRLGELAWATAQTALREQGAFRPGKRLVIGLRGAILYDRVLVGELLANPTPGDNGLRSTLRDSHPETELYPFFEPASAGSPSTL